MFIPQAGVQEFPLFLKWLFLGFWKGCQLAEVHDGSVRGISQESYLLNWKCWLRDGMQMITRMLSHTFGPHTVPWASVLCNLMGAALEFEL